MASKRRSRANTTSAVPGEAVDAAGAPGSPVAVPNLVAGGAKEPVIPSTRTKTAWASVSVGLVLLVVVLVFILQNLKTVRVSFFTAEWKIPLALDLLLAAVLGGLIVLAAGSLRILQLRRLARRRAPRRAGDPNHP
jgi:uncharacterized integral membrane protein